MTSITVEFIPLEKWCGVYGEYCIKCGKVAKYMAKANTFYADYEVCEDCAVKDFAVKDCVVKNLTTFSIQGSGFVHTLNKENILYLYVNEQDHEVNVKFTDGLSVKFVTGPGISEIINPTLFCNFKTWKTATGDVWFTNTSRVLYWSVDKTSVIIKFLHNNSLRINNLIDHNANVENKTTSIDPVTKLSHGLDDLCINNDMDLVEYPGDSLPTPKMTLKQLDAELDALVAARNRAMRVY
jgi:hypothetical protein